MRRRWVFTLSSVLVAAVFVLALLLALAPREAEAQVQAAPLETSHLAEALPATCHSGLAAFPVDHPISAEGRESRTSLPTTSFGTVAELALEVSLAQTGGTTITFDFNDGLQGWAVPALLPAAGNIWGAMGIGALTGALASGAGQITANALNPCVEWYEGVPETMITGGVIGGVAGGAGWWVRQWTDGQGYGRYTGEYAPFGETLNAESTRSGTATAGAIGPSPT